MMLEKTRKKDLTLRDRIVMVSAHLARSKGRSPQHSVLESVSTLHNIDCHTTSRIWRHALERTIEPACSSTSPTSTSTRQGTKGSEGALRWNDFAVSHPINATPCALLTHPGASWRRRSLRMAIVTAGSILSKNYKRVRMTQRLQSRLHIARVMVLVEVAQPRWSTGSRAMWRGKLGVWAFQDFEPAHRSSSNRAVGVMIVKERHVTKSTYRDMLISNMLYVLREKWAAETRGARVVCNKITHHCASHPTTPRFAEL